MTERAIQARREYRRRWQQANKDKVEQYMERYWLKKADQFDRELQDMKGGDINENR